MKKVIENFEEYMGALLLFLMFIVLMMQILARQVFGRPLTWTGELSSLLFVYVGMIGIVVCVKHNQHVAIDIVYERFEGRTKKIVDIILTIVVIVIYLVLVKVGYEIVKMKADMDIITLGISAAWLYAALPVFSFIGLVRFIENIVKEKRFF